MRRNELFNMCDQDIIDGIAKRLHGNVPLLDDSLDEVLLDDERVATGEFPCASSSE
jgi:hypothetical protein